MTRRSAATRRAAALLSFAMLLSACAARTTPPPPAAVESEDRGGSRSRGDRESARATERPRPDGEDRAPGGRATSGGRSARENAAVYDDDGPVGAMARAYLRSEPAARLVVEIDYVRGRRPTDAAVDHLRALLERECDKPGGVSVRVDDTMPEGDGRYSLGEIAALERRFRNAHSSGRTATLWVASLDGSMADEPSTLGLAYSASSVVILPDRVEGAATELVHPGSIERAVLAHEAGHVLALVNIGYKSRYDHEDPDHPKHSKYRSSVMYWAIDDMSVSSILTGGPPDDFDRYDRADLDQLRGA